MTAVYILTMKSCAATHFCRDGEYKDTYLIYMSLETDSYEARDYF